MPRMTNFSDEPAKRMRERGFDLSRGYHGTVYNSAQGVPDEILPSEQLPDRTNNFEGTTHENRAYYYPEGPTDNNAVNRGGSTGAWTWASSSRQEAANRPFRDKPGTQKDAVFLRPVVHKVEAIGHIDGDPVLNPTGEGAAEEMTADRLRVTDTEWVRPISQWGRREVGIQGTLPHDNWSKYYYAGDPGVSNGFKHDVSHYQPGPREVKERFDFPPPAPKAAASKQFETLF